MYSVLKFFKMMKFKLSLILFLCCLLGCQQKSDVDKCVDAQAIVMCNRLIDAEAGKKIIWYKAAEMTEDQCVQLNKKIFVGEWHLECLKAQAGK